MRFNQLDRIPFPQNTDRNTKSVAFDLALGRVRGFPAQAHLPHRSAIDPPGMHIKPNEGYRVRRRNLVQESRGGSDIPEVLIPPPTLDPNARAGLVGGGG